MNRRAFFAFIPVLFFCTFFGDVAFSSQYFRTSGVPPVIREQHLVPISRLPASQKNSLQSVIDASFHYRLQPGVDCTGTFISDKGHFLTALHCVAGCLAKHKAISRTHASDDPVKSEHGQPVYTDLMTLNEDRIDAGITCPILIGNKKSEARVVMVAGKGWFAPKETLTEFAKQYPDDYKKLVNDGYEHGYDFAVLQTELPPRAHCAQLGERVPRWGDALKTISYACVERESLQADGRIPLYSSGRRTAGFRSSQFFKARTPAGLGFKPELIERKDTFFSTLDIEKCGSGSGIFDQQNRLVGIATRVYKSSTEYEYGSSEAVDVAQAWRELSAKLSGSEIKEVTTCATSRRVTQR